MNRRRFCDGYTRRDALRVGAAGLFGTQFGLSRLLAAAQDQGKSLIYIVLEGGLSTIDTWDLKPDAPAEFRGPFNPIATNVSSIQLGEHLPRLAQQMDKFALVRSFGHRNSDHGPADHYMLTGYHPVPGFNPTLSPNNQRPCYGSIIADRLGPRGSVPPYVCVPLMPNSGGPSYLGATAAPLVIEADPNAPGFEVPDVVPPLSLAAERLTSRQELLARVDRFRRSAETQANAAAQSVGVFREKAFDLMTSATARAAFDIESEPTELRDAYGRTSLGQCCLLARRLVEAGVRCAMVDHTNWDTHDNNFHILQHELLPQLDAALAMLLADLSQRGLLESTLIVVSGEFGRTPRINANAGRDHWGPSFTVALAGGGVQGGCVVGRSDERAERPADSPYGPEDLAATICHLLGIDPTEEFYTPEGRPVQIVNGGRVMRELL